MLVRGSRTLSSYRKSRMSIPFGGVRVSTRVSTFWFEDFRQFDNSGIREVTLQYATHGCCRRIDECFPRLLKGCSAAERVAIQVRGYGC
ncbi:hypothetical protein CYMTET_54072 [Cymbomonas tetramitiformis]|uniref:Uncharacterized protein n=1 Tax=Cymbomonas tetramitiformis TaxID=36881 RepID=A0AAE0BFM7_9CHLO|nr:hypothetical protein CYMTET_54072 [Cymbomonas tetramitiformis]